MNFRLQQIIGKILDPDYANQSEIVAMIEALDPYLIGEDKVDIETPIVDMAFLSTVLKELADIKQLLTPPQQKLINVKRDYVIIVKDENTQVLLMGPEMRTYDLNVPEDQLQNEQLIGKIVFDAVQNELIEKKTADAEFAEKVKDAQINIQIIPIPKAAMDAANAAVVAANTDTGDIVDNSDDDK